MKRNGFSWRLLRLFPTIAQIMIAGVVLLMLGCSKPAVYPKPEPSRPSDIKVEVRDGGPVVLTTSTAEFQILPSGLTQATLLRDGQRFTLDEPEPPAAGTDYIVHDGKQLEFAPDFGDAKVLEATGKLGRGKRVEIPAHPIAPSGLNVERVLVMEAYDDSPNIALFSVSYKNAGTSDFDLDEVVTQQHRLNAKQADAQMQPYDMWSFQTAGTDCA